MHRRLDVRRSTLFEGGRPFALADITLPRVFAYEELHTPASGKASAWIEKVAAKSALQATPGNQPTLSSVNGVEILDYELDTANFMSTSPATIVGGIATLTVVCIGSLEQVSLIQKFVETNTGGAGSWGIFQEGGKVAVYAGGAAGQDYVWGNTTLTAARHCIIVEIPFGALGTVGVKPLIWLDGVAQTTSDIVATATSTSMNTSVLTFGKWILAGSQYWDGEQSVCDGWSGSFDDATRSNVVSLARRVYGVAA